MKPVIYFKPFEFIRYGGLKSVSLLAFSLIVLSSCEHEGDATQVEPVSYKTSIAPIMSGNCSMKECHDGGEEFSLKSYSDVMGIVKAGNSKGSELYTVITTPYDFNRMPPAPADPLTKQQRTLIDVWILQGAKDN